ncbi:hypothetical protein EON63_10115 [archaeon]|nr:MAG: hypothetical protein EON63_10115 [archaeon]
MKTAQNTGQYGVPESLPSYSFDSHTGTQRSGAVDSTDLDFNMLTECLFSEEENSPNWTGLGEFDQEVGGGDMQDLNVMQNVSDKEGKVAHIHTTQTSYTIYSTQAHATHVSYTI